jgi:hypothetical protein
MVTTVPAVKRRPGRQWAALTGAAAAITVYAMPDSSPPYMVVVTRGRNDLWRGLERGLESWALDRVQLIWDRRVGLRRWRPAVPADDRRHGERRCAADLDAFGFVVVSRAEGPCSPCLRVTL